MRIRCAWVWRVARTGSGSWSRWVVVVVVVAAAAVAAAAAMSPRTKGAAREGGRSKSLQHPVFPGGLPSKY